MMGRMSYRDPAPRPITVRWVRSSVGLRVATGIFGVLILGLGVVLGSVRSAQLVCDRVCELRSTAALLPTEIRTLDPAQPPQVAVFDARYGKNNSIPGRALWLRWPDEDVQLVRGDTTMVERQAEQTRARLASGRGTLIVGEESHPLLGALALFCIALGLAMFVDGIGLGIRRRFAFDAASRALSTHLSMFGIPMRRRTVIVAPGAQLVSVPIDERSVLGRLGIARPGEEPQLLGVLDVPMYRSAVEEVLGEG
jgi:hypothetical protein